MSGYILDCCTLLNLYSGWGGIRELHDLGDQWYVAKRALDEAGYVFEFDADGALERVDIDRTLLLSQYPLSVLIPDAAESALFVQLAAKVDDGEAETIAVAFHRGLVFVSDDRLAIRVGRELGLPNPIVSTPEILMAWAGADPERIARLPSILRRIEVLAKFRPHKSSPHLQWWLDTLNARP